jgi:hypothetical protein
MAAFFLLLAVLVGVVLVDAVLENTGVATATIFNRSFDQLSSGELLLVFAGLGFLLALFLFLAFGASRTRRTRRKERREVRRDLKGRVEELERENTRLRQDLDRRPEPVAPEDRRPVAAADDRPTAFDDRPGRAGDRPAHDPPGVPGGPEPVSVRRERLDDRTEPTAPSHRDSGATRLGDEDPRRA